MTESPFPGQVPNTTSIERREPIEQRRQRLPAVKTLVAMVSLMGALACQTEPAPVSEPVPPPPGSALQEEFARQAARRARQRAARANAEPPQAATVGIEVSADDLIQAYEANEVRADGVYRGQHLLVTGPVADISITLGTMSVALGGTLTNVTCTMLDDQTDAVAAIDPGQVVTLGGTGAGYFLGPTMRDCRVVSPSER